jgi:hypothetical protein
VTAAGLESPTGIDSYLTGLGSLSEDGQYGHQRANGELLAVLLIAFQCQEKSPHILHGDHWIWSGHDSAHDEEPIQSLWSRRKSQEDLRIVGNRRDCYAR